MHPVEMPGATGLVIAQLVVLDRVQVSWNRARALFPFILGLLFTPNRAHFG
ncbi:MAG: hypothetical protein ACK5KM_03370 [Hyphomicrobiaceae bacterium]